MAYAVDPGDAAKVLIRPEAPGDVPAIFAVTAAAFANLPMRPPTPPGETPMEAPLVDALRASDAWLPSLSMVAVESGEVVGHVVCTRGQVGSIPALGLGPLSVHPDRQRRGVGSALMHAVLGAADALGEPVVVLLGHPDYYPRFGFRPADAYGITPPVAEWAAAFQARALSGYTPDIRGPFTYAEPFSRTF